MTSADEPSSLRAWVESAIADVLANSPHLGDADVLRELRAIVKRARGYDVRDPIWDWVGPGTVARVCDTHRQRMPPPIPAFREVVAPRVGAAQPALQSVKGQPSLETRDGHWIAVTDACGNTHFLSPDEWGPNPEASDIERHLGVPIRADSGEVKQGWSARLAPAGRWCGLHWTEYSAERACKKAMGLPVYDVVQERRKSDEAGRPKNAPTAATLGPPPLPLRPTAISARVAPSDPRYVIQVETHPDREGLHHLRVRVISAAEFKPLTIALQLGVLERPNVEIRVERVGRPGTLTQGTLHVPVGDAWTDVHFALVGRDKEQVLIEVLDVAKDGVAARVTAQQWYSVTPAARADGPPSQDVVKAPAVPIFSRPPAPLTTANGWAETIADEGARAVFLQVEKHGAITEAEVTKFLGSPRAFRRFSLDFELHVSKLPFGVRIEIGHDGKRYIKEGDQ